MPKTIIYLDPWSYIISQGFWPLLCNSNGDTLVNRLFVALGYRHINPVAQGFIITPGSSRPSPVSMFLLPHLTVAFKRVLDVRDDAQIFLDLQPKENPHDQP
jgi:hypothetical protein